ncbi:hypothetical protein HK097_010359, partial [Rhizophlyctis rosea]
MTGRSVNPYTKRPIPTPTLDDGPQPLPNKTSYAPYVSTHHSTDYISYEFRVPKWFCSAHEFKTYFTTTILPPTIVEQLSLHETHPRTFVTSVVLFVLVILLYLRQRIFLRSRIKLYHAPKTANIKYTDGKTGRQETVELMELVREWCPKLTKGVFSPTWWLAGGHEQTLFAAAYGGVGGDLVTYEREMLHLPDGGNIALDWCPGPSKKPFANDQTPCIVICHGLTGGSHELYVQDLVDVVTREKGYRAVVCNFRGCAKTELTSMHLYSAGYTDDLDYALTHILKHIPNAPLFGVGFSLGANVMLKYVGECGEGCRLTGAASVANPFDLLASSHALHRTVLGRYLYSWTLAQSLIRMFKRHMHHFKASEKFNIPSILSVRSIIEFDNAVTRRAFNYRSVHEYYRRGSSAQHVPDVAIPTLLLSALDDPIASREAIPYWEVQGNPNVILATTKGGGHLGWFEGMWPRRRWAASVVGEFATVVVEAGLSLP